MDQLSVPELLQATQGPSAAQALAELERRFEQEVARADREQARADAMAAQNRVLRYVWYLRNRCCVQNRRGFPVNEHLVN